MPDQLAIDGGEAVLPDGAPSWPCRDDDVREALLAAYDDGSWGRYEGPHLERLAAQLAALHQVKFVSLCSSGTFAVELALRALRLGSDDEVVLAGYDFSGNFRCIEAVGARPVLADIDSSGGLDPAGLEAAIGPQTRAVVVSHLHSGLADMPAICQIAKQHELHVIEDACQAPGATVAGRIAGAWGDLGVLSFGGSKLLTAGRGGAVLTNDESLHQRAKIFCERGNHAFPLSELQAAVLRPQLDKLQHRNQTRRDRVKLLAERIDRDLFRLLGDLVGDQASYYKLAWWCDESQTDRVNREQVIAALRAEGLDVGAGFRGFTKRGASRCRRVGALERSAEASKQLLLLHHPVLLESPSVVELVAEAFNKVSRNYIAKE